jgi:N-acetylglutamate synthase
VTDAARVAALEASGRAALPALHEETVGGWLIRVSGGATKRVNSANPLAPDAIVLNALAAVERLYAAHHLPCRFRLTPLANDHADAMLEGRGFEVVDRSITMVAPLVSRARDPGVAVAERADSAAIARGEALSGRSPDAATVQARLLAAIPGPLALASIEQDGAVVASGYASLGEGRAQLSDIVVAQNARGRGHGRRLVAALLGWAQAQGCGEAMLQVLEANIVARALYRSLGFADAYAYHYRVRR